MFPLPLGSNIKVIVLMFQDSKMAPFSAPKLYDNSMACLSKSWRNCVEWWVSAMSPDVPPAEHLLVSSPEPKAHWWAFTCSIDRHPSSVRRQHFQTSSPQKSLGQLKPNFMWSLGRTKCPSNGLDHITKMATMPFMVRSSPEPNNRWYWNLVYSIGYSST